MTVRHFRIWHHPEVLSGARHDCYRRGTGRRPEIADSAEFDPQRSSLRAPDLDGRGQPDGYTLLLLVSPEAQAMLTFLRRKRRQATLADFLISTTP
jgi:hypothetical protein